MMTEHRIRNLELGYEELYERVARLERTGGAAEQAGSPPPAPPPPAPRAPAPAPPVAASPTESRRRTPAPKPRSGAGPGFEDLLGGRILALIGAAAVVLAGAFFFALAISNGWIGEAARTILAGAGSTALLALGV